MKQLCRLITFIPIDLILNPWKSPRSKTSPWCRRCDECDLGSHTGFGCKFHLTALRTFPKFSQLSRLKGLVKSGLLAERFPATTCLAVVFIG